MSKKIEKRIVCNGKILSGKPVVNGTRLSVEFIVSLISQGWTEKEILENYPQLTKEDLTAVSKYEAKFGVRRIRSPKN